jgi:hypothetical protein
MITLTDAREAKWRKHFKNKHFRTTKKCRVSTMRMQNGAAFMNKKEKKMSTRINRNLLVTVENALKTKNS